MNEENEDYYFGSCPECGADPVILNVGRVHWCCCQMHRVAWEIGENLFSGWREETQDDWARNAKFLETCTIITESAAHYGAGQRRVDAIAAELLDWL